MDNQKKKIIIGVGIATILIILLIFIITSINKKSKEQDKKIEKIDLSEVINIKDIETLKYNLQETEEEISSKYQAWKSKKEIKAIIEAGETKGKIIYIRGTENINIYKTEYELNKYEDKTIKINEIMEKFELICKGYMEGIEEYEETEWLYGENKADFELPLEESIYNEGRLYSKTYKNVENEYNINFYRKDNKIICEFAHII